MMFVSNQALNSLRTGTERFCRIAFVSSAGKSLISRSMRYKAWICFNAWAAKVRFRLSGSTEL